MKRTGATGKHLHIGPDTSARKMFNYRISKAQQGMKIAPFIEYESAEIPESNLELPPINSSLTDPPNNIIGFNSNGVPIVRSSMPTATRSQNTDPQITINMENNKNSISNKVKGNQKELLSQTIDKLSKEDPNIGKIKQFLMDTAALESSYKMNSTSKASSASGWFGFLDSRYFFTYASVLPVSTISSTIKTFLPVISSDISRVKSILPVLSVPM